MTFEVGFEPFFENKLEELENMVKERQANVRRLEAQRNELNSRVRLLREELQHERQVPTQALSAEIQGVRPGGEVQRRKDFSADV